MRIRNASKDSAATLEYGFNDRGCGGHNGNEMMSASNS